MKASTIFQVFLSLLFLAFSEGGSINRLDRAQQQPQEVTSTAGAELERGEKQGRRDDRQIKPTYIRREQQNADIAIVANNSKSERKRAEERVRVPRTQDIRKDEMIASPEPQNQTQRKLINMDELFRKPIGQWEFQDWLFCIFLLFILSVIIRVFRHIRCCGCDLCDLITCWICWDIFCDPTPGAYNLC